MVQPISNLAIPSRLITIPVSHYCEKTRWALTRLQIPTVYQFSDRPSIILLAVITLIGWELPHGEMGTLFSGGFIPLLNILVAIKVALGSWAVILLFIRYRGLL